MRFDLSRPAQPEGLAFYPSHHCAWRNGTLHVLGADPATAARVEAYVRSWDKPLDSDSVRALLLEVEGHFALVFTDPDEVTVVTDPYGIIKLYWLQGAETSWLLDDPDAAKTESLHLDREALQYFLVSSYTPAGHTFFRELAKLEPCTFYQFRGGRLARKVLYARLDQEPLGGDDFQDAFHETLGRSLDRSFQAHDKACLCLTGGIDSSVLYRLALARGWGDRMRLRVGRTLDMGQRHPVDNDLDVAFAQRLAAEDGRMVEVVPYALAHAGVAEDFHWLCRHLFTEYAPALAYVGLGRSAAPDELVLNGQNADSVLSFGSMGSPAFRGGRVTGLNGLFSRNFYFFGDQAPRRPLGLISRALRQIYYRRAYPDTPMAFDDRSFFLGIGLHPENRYFTPRDPVFGSLERPDRLAEWFQAAYLDPLQRDHGHLRHHARALLLYNRTYMQGSANRSTVLTSILQGRKTYLPYTSLRLFELMGSLAPDWRYAWQGKHPNIDLGRRRLELPRYILRRCDPPDSESSPLLYRALAENRRFFDMAQSLFRQADFSRYEGVLKPGILHHLREVQQAPKPQDLPLLLRMTWLEATFQRMGGVRS